MTPYPHSGLAFDLVGVTCLAPEPDIKHSLTQ
jgi:hypothetical protein